MNYPVKIFGLFVSELESFWAFPVEETCEVLLPFCEEAAILNYFVLDSAYGEGAFLSLTQTPDSLEKAVHQFCKTLAPLLTPSAELIETLHKKVASYNLDWNAELEEFILLAS